jgi:hypothetical protein
VNADACSLNVLYSAKRTGWVLQYTKQETRFRRPRFHLAVQSIYLFCVVGTLYTALFEEGMIHLYLTRRKKGYVAENGQLSYADNMANCSNARIIQKNSITGRSN